MNRYNIDVLLIGKTGNGKSATGNSILRKPQTFKVMPSTQSVTTDTQSGSSFFRGRKFMVVDGPGVGDTRMSDEEALELVQNQMGLAITANPDGFHAFLLVVRYGGRFTKEDIQTVECLKKIFGTDFVKNFCIIVVTCGDNLESDVEETGMNFEQWLEAQEGVFKKLLRQCRNRVVLFDNKTKVEKKKNEQVASLLSVIDGLGGKRYTDENFEKAKKLRERQMIEAKEPRIRNETLWKTAKLNKEIENIQRYLYLEDQVEGLKKVKTNAKELYQRLKDKDEGTGALEYPIQIAYNVLKRIKSELANCQATIKDHRQTEMERERQQREMEEKLERQRRRQERRMEEERWERERQREEEREQFLRRQERERRRRDREERDLIWWAKFDDYHRRKIDAEMAGYFFPEDPEYEVCHIL